MSDWTCAGCGVEVSSANGSEDEPECFDCMASRLARLHQPCCLGAGTMAHVRGCFNHPEYFAPPLPTKHWCNYCDDMADHLSSGHPGGKPMWRIVDSHECTRCGFLDRSRDGIMAHLATCEVV